MISVRDLSFRYPGNERDVLANLSIEFPAGSFTAIMGANGSGKSTLARCLNGLLRPTSGEVLVDGLNTNNASHLPTIRRRVGFVFQDPNLQMTSATVERELAFGLQNVGTSVSEIHRKVEEALHDLVLERKRLSPPSTLAGGEKQRLALAAVMLLDPKYLVLDEPTSFLSKSSRQALMQRLLQLREKHLTTIILVTQFLDEALHANRLIVLHDARIVFDDLPNSALRYGERVSSWGIYVPSDIGART